MTDLPDPTTDPVPEEDTTPHRYGFFGTLVGLPSLEQNIKEFIMGRLDPITTAQANQSAALANLATQQQQLADQIAALVAGSVTQEEIDAVAVTAQANADAIQAAADKADASLEVPGEDDVTPPAEPPVV